MGEEHKLCAYMIEEFVLDQIKKGYEITEILLTKCKLTKYYKYPRENREINVSIVNEPKFGTLLRVEWPSRPKRCEICGGNPDTDNCLDIAIAACNNCSEKLYDEKRKAAEASGGIFGMCGIIEWSWVSLYQIPHNDDGKG
jgi:hypothetical protein